MSGETTITMTGNVVADPELRFTPSGAAVCNFRVASTPRKFNRQTNEFEDGEPLFLGVAVWRQQAEHVAESVQRGMRVIIVGRLTQRQYEANDGSKRSSYEIQADEVAPSLLRATATVTKATSGAQNGQQRPQHGHTPQQPAHDPWATQQQQGYSDEPPF
ncbi:single-stranded DNA-binding protein [Streptomyces sp. SID4919]|uniref:single-stranded DNA-binding protein n=1 Tax=unclassified Streptomyces TaxID=2593676 RepID=UPI000823D69D|nr:MULTISPECIES: single-stranded DNA-binding protein [unclassified Streptomyces]MYY08808.1 single-stranded DNA-binding protein [Streptomyces sp. SID4919]SCK25433.1 single-strand binding protein [Streptomyces sp. AmelKG-E11A]